MITLNLKHTAILVFSFLATTVSPAFSQQTKYATLAAELNSSGLGTNTLQNLLQSHPDVLSKINSLDGAFTFFAATDTAFSMTPYRFLSPLDLKEVLMYHVVDGYAYTPSTGLPRVFLPTLRPNMLNYGLPTDVRVD
jgi:hypothetical protein